MKNVSKNLHVLDEKSDEKLLQALSLGDRQALMELYDRYWKDIYRIIKYRTGFAELAEDIAQEVFIQIWDLRQQMIGVRNLKAYLATIARNAAFRKLERLRQEIEVMQEFNDRHGRVMADHSMEDEMLEKQYNALLTESLEGLTPRQLEVFKLSKEQHLSHEEIGTLLNITTNAVKKHMSDALRYIRQRLKNHLAMLVALVALLPDSLPQSETTTAEKKLERILKGVDNANGEVSNNI